jgi:hypothetical protein
LPALKADDDIVFFGQKVDHSPLAFIAPLMRLLRSLPFETSPVYDYLFFDTGPVMLVLDFNKKTMMP